LENFAKSRNLDPLLADTWYGISADSIRQEKVLFFIFYFFMLFLPSYFPPLLTSSALYLFFIKIGFEGRYDYSTAAQRRIFTASTARFPRSRV
jgi:hypothetical protein